MRYKESFMELQNVMVIRFGEFEGLSFIEEHKNIIDKNGDVWMLKLGRNPYKKALVKFEDNDAKIILCSPKKRGNKLYLCDVCGYWLGKPKENFVFPNYYHNILDEYGENRLEGTWINISGIHEIPMEDYEKIILVSNEKKLIDVINETRTSIMYVNY